MANEPSEAPVRSHKVLTTTLVTLATIIGFFACFAVWANRQALNTDNWTKTSSNLLANHAVQSALSVYLVNELYAAADVQGRLEKELPGEIKGLSGPVAAGLRQLAGEAVPKLLATQQVQELWRQANRNAHEQLLAILNGGGKVVSTSNGEVVLDLHQLVTQLGSQLGVSSQVEAAQEKLNSAGGAAAKSAAEENLGIKLPPSSGRIDILKASQLKTAQDVAKGIKGLAIILPAIALLLFALAIWFAAGRRRVMLRTVGWCFFGVGVTLLLARRVAGEQVVNGLVTVPANKPAGEAVWSIGTSLLYGIAIAMLLYGLVIVIAAWLAGHTRIATSLRHVAAPWMREHEAGSYGVAGVLLLLIVLWGPTPATRQLLPILGFAALGAFGVYILRRQTEAEFPAATSGESMAMLRSMNPFGKHHRDADAPPAHRDRPAPAEPATAEPATAESAPVADADATAATEPKSPAGS